jgi:hypothetical protein
MVLHTPTDLAFEVSRQHGQERPLAVAFAVKRTAGRHDQTMSSLDDKAHASVDIRKSLSDSYTHPLIRQRRMLNPKCRCLRAAYL